MIDKWVTSFRFNEIKNSILFSAGSDVSLGSLCSCHLRFFSKLCMCVVDKKVNYAGLLCCHNCNNSQMTPGITMHELTCNRPAVRRKWIKFIQLKRADFLAAPHHAHLCSEHFSECDFTNPMKCCMEFAKSHSLKCSLHKWAWCGAARKSARLNCISLIHFRLTVGWLHGSSCIVIPGVICKLLQFAATQ